MIKSFAKILNIVPQVDQPVYKYTAADLAKKGAVLVDLNGNIIDQITAAEYSAIGNDYSQFSRILFDLPDNKDTEDLIQDSVRQLIHYLSVGFDIPDNIPLKLSGLEKDQEINFKVYRRISRERAFFLFYKHLKTLASPSLDLISNYKALITVQPPLAAEVNDIKSFELRIVAFYALDIVPENPEHFMRYLIYVTTGSTLLIKSPEVIREVKDNSREAYVLLEKANLEKLAEVFYRYKPLFLALRAYGPNRKIVNKIRRLAKLHHRPKSQLSLKNYTSISDPVSRRLIVGQADNMELIKLYNYLAQIRDEDEHEQTHIYQIRNGKTFMNTSSVVNFSKVAARREANYILKVLGERLAPVFADKLVYIPKHLYIAAPTSGKQFVGNMPYGSSIMTMAPEAFRLGIHWKNLPTQRVDLDLHMNTTGVSFGWNRSKYGGGIMFSGDITDAPTGAAEIYQIRNGTDRPPLVFSVSDYTMTSAAELTFFISEATGEKVVYDPNAALVPPIDITMRGQVDLILGIVGEHEFYFYGGSVSKGRIPNADYGEIVRVLLQKMDSQLGMIDLLDAAGAEIVNDPTVKADYSLDPTSFTAASLIELIS